MSKVIPFNFNATEVRVIDVLGEPMFVASDVCNVLGLSNPSMAVQTLDEDEYTLSTIEGSHRQINLVNESGLYALIFKSRKEVAKTFRKWVTSEVLPSIRKTGTYNNNSLYELPEDYLSALKNLTVAVEKNIALEKQAANDAPKVAFADAVSDSINCVTIQDFAKSVGSGQNRLFALLRQDGYVQTRRGQRNKPYQQYVDQGLFKLNEGTYKNKRSGEIETYFRTLITPKGQLYLTNKYFKDSHKSA